MIVTQPLVHCVVVLDKATPSFSAATLLVRVDDVSRADSASITVAEAWLKPLAHLSGAESVWQVSLYGALPEPRKLYSIWAHLDIDLDGKISSGDYITTQSYPVLTFDHPREVIVQLTRV